MPVLPAIAIGGPPHSGKSVLTYSLTQLLRTQGVDHYVLRACPDGEGDWSNEIKAESVRVLRYKGQFSPSFVAKVCKALAGRHLPLLVDVGGRPTLEQEAIFDCCTHAILLAPDETAMTEWRVLAARHQLVVLAELYSSLTEPEAIFAEYPLLQGRIHGLERHRPVQSQLLARLAWNLKTLFGLAAVDLPAYHDTLAPTELVVDLTRMKKAIQAIPSERWRPADLPAALAYLPAATPLALYGRGPNWLYAALTIHAWPAPCYQFDARLGWVEPPILQPTPLPPVGPLAFTHHHRQDHDWLEAQIVDSYLDYSEADHLPIPTVAAERGLVLGGKIPHWLLTALVRAYWPRPWLAIYQPQAPQPEASANAGPVVVAAAPTAIFQVGQQVDLARA